MNQEQHKAACLDRWNHLVEEARQKRRAMKARRVTRSGLEAWLRQQSEMDERSLRKMLNGER